MVLTCKDTLHPAFLERPDSDTRIVTRCGKTTVIWAKAETPDGFPRSRTLPRGQIVHIGLEVLNDPALVRGCKIRSRVRKCKRANSGVVGLEDGFKIES